MWRRLLAASCALVLLALALYVYSPLHRDDPIAGRACPFCFFQHLNAEPAVVAVMLPAPASSAWMAARVAAPQARVLWRRIPLGRAPPSSR
jgi:hypothetical protein